MVDCRKSRIRRNRTTELLPPKNPGLTGPFFRLKGSKLPSPGA
jgi:hypothetical protein